MPPARSLQTLLRLREHVESQAERTLASAQTELARQGSLLQDLDRQMKGVAQEHQAATLTVSPAAAFQARAVQYAGLQADRSRVLHQIHLQEQVRDQARQHFLVARQTRETLSELLEQQRIAHAQEERRMEQKRLNDLFSMRLRQRR